MMGLQAGLAALYRVRSFPIKLAAVRVVSK